MKRPPKKRALAPTSTILLNTSMYLSMFITLYEVNIEIYDVFRLFSGLIYANLKYAKFKINSFLMIVVGRKLSMGYF